MCLEIFDFSSDFWETPWKLTGHTVFGLLGIHDFILSAYILRAYSTPPLVHAGLWYGNGRARLRDGDRNRGKIRPEKRRALVFPFSVAFFYPGKNNARGPYPEYLFVRFPLLQNLHIRSLYIWFWRSFRLNCSFTVPVLVLNAISVCCQIASPSLFVLCNILVWRPTSTCLLNHCYPIF